MQRRKPTVEDVAFAAGVSRATGSRVVNGKLTVAPAARDRVHRAIADLGYPPDPAARALATGYGNVVELVVVDDEPHTFGTNTYYGRVVAGIVEAIRNTDAQMRVHVVDTAGAAHLLAR